MVLSTILNDPKNSEEVDVPWDADDDPSTPLLTFIRLKEPLSEIGPVNVVPIPTDMISINSSFTFNISPLLM